MANMIKKTNGSKKDFRISRLMIIVSLLGFAIWCAIGAFVLGVLKFNSLPVIIIFALFMLAWIGAGLYFWKRSSILKAGVEGEKIAGKVLNKLPDEYTVIQNAVVTHDGKKSEIDLIVVSENGVTIVEAKNLKGTIMGDFGDRKWTKTKIKGEKEYVKKINSPVKQLSTQINRLAEFLRDNGIDVFVEGAVCFTNPDIELNVGGSKRGIRLFTLSEGKDNLLDYITDRKKTLSETDLAKVKEILGANE